MALCSPSTLARNLAPAVMRSTLIATRVAMSRSGYVFGEHGLCRSVKELDRGAAMTAASPLGFTACLGRSRRATPWFTSTPGIPSDWKQPPITCKWSSRRAAANPSLAISMCGNIDRMPVAGVKGFHRPERHLPRRLPGFAARCIKPSVMHGTADIAEHVLCRPNGSVEARGMGAPGSPGLVDLTPIK